MKTIPPDKAEGKWHKVKGKINPIVGATIKTWRNF